MLQASSYRGTLLLEERTKTENALIDAKVCFPPLSYSTTTTTQCNVKWFVLFRLIQHYFPPGIALALQCVSDTLLNDAISILWGDGDFSDSSPDGTPGAFVCSRRNRTSIAFCFSSRVSTPRAGRAPSAPRADCVHASVRAPPRQVARESYLSDVQICGRREEFTRHEGGERRERLCGSNSVPRGDGSAIPFPLSLSTISLSRWVPIARSIYPASSLTHCRSLRSKRLDSRMI